MKLLEGVRYPSEHSVLHIACLKGCLDYLGAGISYSWLCGGTGHAFVINIHAEVDVQGVNDWNPQMLFELAPNLGYRCTGLKEWGPSLGDGFPAKQQEARDLIQRSIDRGNPCYGFCVDPANPDYSPLCGYHDEGYYFTHIGSSEPSGPIAWEKLGTMWVPMLEVYAVELCEPASDEVVVREAFRMALRHAAGPQEWIRPEARSGLAAFTAWADCLESGEALLLHHDWNLQVWLDCRKTAVEFLTEAKSRIGKAEDHFDAAMQHYRLVADRLREAKSLVPATETTWDERLKFTSPEAAQLIRAAGEAEGQALSCLEQIVAEL
ncbi:MAG: hypothetical protein HY318_17730 [Armatimonadetes bacterium]|nr:hypothetical protein [Armatimonadota bacterium]